MQSPFIMGRLLKVFHYLFIFNFLVACVPSNGEFTARIAPTSKPQSPSVAEEKGFKVARNALRLDKVQTQFDPESKMMKMTGTLEYLSVRDGQWVKFPVSMAGVLDKHGFIVIKGAEGKSTVTPRAAAKATCLSDKGTCYSAFIDIYLYTDGVIYTQQFEFKEELKDDKSPSLKGSEPPSAKQAEGDFNAYAHEPVGELGPYVGTPLKDIEILLNLKPKPPVKIELPLEMGKKAELPAPEPITSNVKENRTPLVQAIGAVNNGRLENAVDVLRYAKAHQPIGYSILRPERKAHFATNELTYVLAKMGAWTRENLPGHELSVGDLSKSHGGLLGSHKSHQTGLDADVAYFFNNHSFQGFFASAVAIDKPHGNWMLESQWKFFKAVVESQYIDRIFIHAVLKKALCEYALKNGEISKESRSGLAYQTHRRLISDSEHHNHFHIRVKCSEAQIRCRQMAEPSEATGCF